MVRHKSLRSQSVGQWDMLTLRVAQPEKLAWSGNVGGWESRLGVGPRAWNIAPRGRISQSNRVGLKDPADVRGGP